MKTIKHIYVAPDCVVISNVPSFLMAGSGSDFPAQPINRTALQNDANSADQPAGTGSQNEQNDYGDNWKPLPAEGFGTNY